MDEKHLRLAVAIAEGLRGVSRESLPLEKSKLRRLEDTGRVDLLAFELFGRHVMQGAKQGCRRGERRARVRRPAASHRRLPLGDAKVQQLRASRSA